MKTAKTDANRGASGIPQAVNQTGSDDVRRNSRTKKILGMRPGFFLGAVALVLLVAAGFYGIPFIRRVTVPIRRRHRAAMHAQRWKQLANTPEGADRWTVKLIVAGNKQFRVRHYPEALRSYYEALDVARKFNFRSRAGACFINIANTYNGMGSADSAEVYYRKAGELAAFDTSSVNAAAVGQERGAALVYDLGKQDSAIVLLRRTIEQAHNQGKTRDELLATGNLGALYLLANEPDSSTVILRRAVELARRSLDGRQLAQSLRNLGLAFCQIQAWDSAYNTLQNAFDAYYRFNDQRLMWFVRDDLDSIRKWAGISDTVSRSTRAGVKRPRDVDFNPDLELMLGTRPGPW
jgi:tetratricopeptide (TPR) repeat protein